MSGYTTHLVVDLEDLVILPEPGTLALASGYNLGDKHADLGDEDMVRKGSMVTLRLCCLNDLPHPRCSDPGPGRSRTTRSPSTKIRECEVRFLFVCFYLTLVPLSTLMF